LPFKHTRKFLSARFAIRVVLLLVFILPAYSYSKFIRTKPLRVVETEIRSASPLDDSKGYGRGLTRRMKHGKVRMKPLVSVNTQDSVQNPSHACLEPLKVIETQQARTAALVPLKVIGKKTVPPPSRGDFFDFRTLDGSPAGRAILRIILNEEDKGEYFVMLTADGDALFSRDDFKKLGFREIPKKAVRKNGQVSFISLSPEIRFETDEKQSALIITANPHLLQRQRVNCVRLCPLDVAMSKNNSAFLNYSLNCNLGDSFDFRTLNIPIETGIRIGDYLSLSEFSYIQNKSNHSAVRGMSRIIKDDPVTLRRYVVGDYVAGSGILGSTGTFGGLSISKNFSMKPYLIRFPGLSLSGILQNPSEIEVYVDGIMVRKEKLSPGEFEFLNLPVTTGAGDITYVVRDAYGREERIVHPFYASSNLLRPGLHEYSYNLGFRREAFGRKSFEYGDLCFSGFHRLGLYRTFTGGLRAEADRNTLNFGPAAAFSEKLTSLLP